MRPSMRVREVLESALYVDDLEASQSFYTELLGLTFFSRVEGRHVFLRCGNRMVLLFDAKETAVSAGGSMDAPGHGAHGAGHLAFAVRANEMDLWKSHLTENSVEIEREIQFGKSRSIYFRDPSGNSLEITSPLLWGIPEDTLPSAA